MGARRHSSPTRKRLVLNEKKKGGDMNLDKRSQSLVSVIHQLNILAIIRPKTGVKLYTDPFGLVCG